MPQWSRCSGSMFVTTATTGASRRNEPSLSSASATSRSPRAEARAAAPARVAAAPAHAPADHGRRVEAGRVEHVGDQRGGRRLAVGPGDGDAVLHAHDLGEHLGPRDHRDAAPLGLRHLRVAGADRRGDDDDVGVALEVARVVADVDRDRRGRAAARRWRRPRGRSRSPGSRGRAGSRRGRTCRRRRCRRSARGARGRRSGSSGVPLRAPASSARHSARMRSAASGRASRAAAAAIAASRAGSATSSSRASRSASPVSRAGSITRAAPARSRSRAFSSCSPPPTWVSGTSRAGRPARASSARVMAPARQTTRSAAAVARRHVALEGDDRGAEARRGVSRGDALAIRLAGLVHDLEARRVEARQDRRAARR